jgi:hypothetical protein
VRRRRLIRKKEVQGEEGRKTGIGERKEERRDVERNRGRDGRREEREKMVAG